MKHNTLTLAALLMVPLAALHAADEPNSKALGMLQKLPLGFGKLECNNAAPRQGEKWELTFSLAATFQNPFDPAEVRVDLELGTPSGGTLTVPAFFFVPCALAADGVVRPAGTPVWKVRYTPVESGAHRYRLRAKDRTGTIESAWGEFRCQAAKVRGALRVSRQVSSAFEFADGTPYQPLGWNLHPWSPPDREALGRLPAMLANLDRLAACGGNFVRLRADSFYVPIEAAANEKAGFLGLGFYHSGAAWEIDRIYEKAENKGLLLMHCFLEGNSYSRHVHNPELRNR